MSWCRLQSDINFERSILRSGASVIFARWRTSVAAVTLPAAGDEARIVADRCGACAPGLGAALPFAHLMASLPFGMARSDASIFLIVALGLAAVGVFACWLPARRAAGLDPVKAIRHE